MKGCVDLEVFDCQNCFVGNGYYNKYISDELEDSWKKIDVYSKWSLEEWHDPGNEVFYLIWPIQS